MKFTCNLGMRVLLEKGMQRKLLEDLKSENFFTWKEFADFCNVSIDCLYSWKNEKSLMPYNFFMNLNSKYYPFEIKDEFWASKKNVNLPIYDEKLAEFVGILLGDGNIFSGGIRVCGDSRYDREYLVNYVAPLIEDLFHVKPSFYLSKVENCLYLIVSRVDLICFFKQMGLKPGKKIINKSTIPNWIFENEFFLKSCLRGIYDTDGSVYELLPHWPGIFQINLDNKNLILLEDSRRALFKLGFHVSKICNLHLDKPRTYITRKEDVKRFYFEIGFNNPKHKYKLNQFVNS